MTSTRSPVRSSSEAVGIVPFVLLTGLLWTLLLGGVLAWNLYTSGQQTQDQVLIAARASFNKDQAFRLWATSHGGVYVPTDERTPPNPYLSHIPERDLVTPSGRRLTLMNPAYIMSQGLGN